ncbi:hypothetical protein TNCV_1795961 [Trichonephila clavipes]|nr:hypothetical protein TNCV_1795961 [Trichonephila clavipes]
MRIRDFDHWATVSTLSSSKSSRWCFVKVMKGGEGSGSSPGATEDPQWEEWGCMLNLSRLKRPSTDVVGFQLGCRSRHLTVCSKLRGLSPMAFVCFTVQR